MNLAGFSESFFKSFFHFSFQNYEYLYTEKSCALTLLAFFKKFYTVMLLLNQLSTQVFMEEKGTTKKANKHPAFFKQIYC